MALSWLGALKAVPWSDVVQAAPGIVQGARKLFTAAKSYTAKAPVGAPGAAASTVTADGVAERLGQIESALGTLQEEQRSSAELIRSLAEQNANIVAALDALGKRVRILSAACAVLGGALCVLALVWFVR